MNTAELYGVEVSPDSDVQDSGRKRSFDEVAEEDDDLYAPDSYDVENSPTASKRARLECEDEEDDEEVTSMLTFEAFDSQEDNEDAEMDMGTEEVNGGDGAAILDGLEAGPSSPVRLTAAQKGKGRAC